MPKPKIRILATGGTFDKEYDLIHGDLFFKETHLPEILSVGRCKLDIEIRTLMLIDSTELTKTDRKSIFENCKNAKEDKIIITQGTDTMAETALFLGEKINQLKNKTIVLTGAMIPYAFGTSDGFFNIGTALGFVQTLSPGVYVVMNGRFFEWGRVKKNKKTGIFEKIKKK